MLVLMEQEQSIFMLNGYRNAFKPLTAAVKNRFFL